MDTHLGSHPKSSHKSLRPWTPPQSHDPATKTNGEFDVALDYGDYVALFEAKYYRNPMTLDEIHREVGQIRRISELNVAKIGFIAANGFDTKEDA